MDMDVIVKFYNMDFGIPKMSFVFYPIIYGNCVKGKCQGAMKEGLLISCMFIS